MLYLRRKVTMIIAGSCFLYMFTGCVKAPDQELAAAKAAVQAAQDAEADKYCANNFKNVKKAMDAAEAEIARQQSKFMGRKYTIAKKYLQNATQIANEIKVEAPKIKEEMVSTTKENLAIVKSMLKETADDIKKASRLKDKNIITELKADLSAADSAAVSAAAEFNTGNIHGAVEKLAEVQAYIKKITDTLKPPSEEPM